jgi:adenosylcobinamide-GDP ribazoletransferase
MFRRVLIAVGLLTTVPVRTERVSADELGGAVAWFPLVGLGLGGVAALIATALLGLMPAMLAAVGVVAALALLTGGLHLDGWCDVFDGLGGGRGDRARTLEIMRDSRIGAHGAAALCLLLVAKIAALTAVMDTSDVEAVIVFAVVGRCCGAALVVIFPYARAEGLGRGFSQSAGGAELVVAIMTTAAVIMWLDASLWVAAAVAAAAALAFGTWMSRRLGGLTGDVYGAGIELAELAFLVAC